MPSSPRAPTVDEVATADGVTVPPLGAHAMPPGLTSAEACELLLRHGPNALPEPARPSRARRLVAQLRSPMVGLLGLAAALSLALGDALDAGVILVVVIVNAVLGFVQEERADRATASLRVSGDRRREARRRAGARGGAARGGRDRQGPATGRRMIRTARAGRADRLVDVSTSTCACAAAGDSCRGGGLIDVHS